MYNKTRTYDLSFVAPSKKERTKPRIVFTIHSAVQDELNTLLQRLVERTNVAEYLGIEKVFTFLVPDLFGNTEFGFGKCGLALREGDEVRLYIELSQQSLREAVLTINLFTMALNYQMKSGAHISNELQQLRLETCCDAKAAVHGHSIGGYVSSRVTLWLKARGSEAKEGHYAPLPEAIVKAMQQVWRAITSSESKKWTSDCGGMISRDGRLMLTCFGDACDVAIYPDNDQGYIDHGVRFSCHNLDHATQQITLIAGLAKLCELARQDE